MGFIVNYLTSKRNETNMVNATKLDNESHY